MVSEIFIKMYQHLQDYDPAKGTFSTWLFRIAHNVMKDYYGSKAYTSNVPWDDGFDPEDENQETPEKQYLTKERSQELKTAIMKLSEKEQRWMCWWICMAAHSNCHKGI